MTLDYQGILAKLLSKDDQKDTKFTFFPFEDFDEEVMLLLRIHLYQLHTLLYAFLFGTIPVFLRGSDEVSFISPVVLCVIIGTRDCGRVRCCQC